MSILKKFAVLTLFIFLAHPITISAVSAEPVTIMSWNFEWLSSKPVTHLKESKRSQADLNTYKTIISKHKPKVIAFQEVNDVAVVNKVLGNSYKIAMSDRMAPQYKSHQYGDINQYTGVAIDQSLVYSDPDDIVLSPNRKLRFATYVVLEPKATPPIHLLSVHLKAGCIGKYLSNEESCQTLAQQAQELHDWVNQRNMKNQSFLILGDFNHNLAYRNDWMWKAISENTSPTPSLLTSNTKSHCVPSGKTKRHRYLVDHIVASKNISTNMISQILYSPEDQKYQLSDHCPLEASLQY